MPQQKQEINFKVKFCERYFDKKLCEYDVLNRVDILLKDKFNAPLLYIESKDTILNDNELRKALAQVILTNKKQKNILSKVALIYRDSVDLHNDILILIDCSDNSVMYNNDINWNQEQASNPTKDAIDRINDRIKDKTTVYQNEEIKDFYKKLLNSQDTRIDITLKNINVVYNQWKNQIEFEKPIENEQELINLFLIDVLNGTKYKKKVKDNFLGEIEKDLIREGTNINKYNICEIKTNKGMSKGFLYENEKTYLIKDIEKYNRFWSKYSRPPEQQEFLNILERSATLYSDKYRKDTGGEYTPFCFVEKQMEILRENYNLDEFIVFDPCAGVGNLENHFSPEFKRDFCFLSTLEQMDVDTMKIKGFENCKVYDYLKNSQQPTFKYQGKELDINEIAKRENKKLMVIMNPPYQRVKGFTNNLAIEFFNRVLELKPQVIVFYYKTENILNEFHFFIDSSYKIISHNISNMKTTFLLTNGSVSQVIFDKDKGEPINKADIKVDRYEISKDNENKLNYIKTYHYNQSKSNLIKEIEKIIKQNETGSSLGHWFYLSDVLCLGNSQTKNNLHKITSNNLKYCLLSKGINFNTHSNYFEHNDYCYRGG